MHFRGRFTSNNELTWKLKNQNYRLISEKKYRKQKFPIEHQTPTNIYENGYIDKDNCDIYTKSIDLSQQNIFNEKYSNILLIILKFLGHNYLLIMSLLSKNMFKFLNYNPIFTHLLNQYTNISESICPLSKKGLYLKTVKRMKYFIFKGLENPSRYSMQFNNYEPKK